MMLQSSVNDGYIFIIFIYVLHNFNKDRIKTLETIQKKILLTHTKKT